MSGNVFAGDQVVLNVGFDVASRRLGSLARDGVLVRASEHAYAAGVAVLVESAGLVAGRSRLASVDSAVMRRGSGLVLRWEAIGPGGALFPALDADLTLSPAGENTTLLALAGVYRVPGQAVTRLDPASADCAAMVTIRSVLAWLACGFVHPGGTAEPAKTAGPAPRRSRRAAETAPGPSRPARPAGTGTPPSASAGCTGRPRRPA